MCNPDEQGGAREYPVPAQPRIRNSVTTGPVLPESLTKSVSALAYGSPSAFGPILY
jgi:hypothetical protein